MGESEWLLKPGDKILRKDLHQRYGGRRGGGIGPSTLTANVLIFAEAPHPDPVSSAPRIGEAFVLTGARQSPGLTGGDEGNGEGNPCIPASFADQQLRRRELILGLPA